MVTPSPTDSRTSRMRTTQKLHRCLRMSPIQEHQLGG